MHIPRFSPAILPVVMAVFLLFGSSDVQAGGSNKSGNPYGNGTFYSDNGTFSTIVRSTNGFLGTVQFTTSTSNSTSASSTNSLSSGLASIYVAGQQYTGIAYGVIDPATKTISATYQAGYIFSQYVNIFTTNAGTVTTANTAYSNSINTNITSTVSPLYTNTYTTNVSSSIAYLGTNGVPTPLYSTNITVTTSISGYTNTLVTNYTTTANVLQKTSTNDPTVADIRTLETFTNSVSGQFSAALNNGNQIQSFSGTGVAQNYDLIYGGNTFYVTSVAGSRVSQ